MDLPIILGQPIPILYIQVDGIRNTRGVMTSRFLYRAPDRGGIRGQSPDKDERLLPYTLTP